MQSEKNRLIQCIDHFIPKLSKIPFLSERDSAPQEGLEPTTLRLTAECSAIELLRHVDVDEPHPIGIRRRPTLPGRVQPSTIGAEGLNFCVRNGNRWDPFAIATGNCFLLRARLPNACPTRYILSSVFTACLPDLYFLSSGPACKS